jgi:hypothetical protein
VGAGAGERRWRRARGAGDAPRQGLQEQRWRRVDGRGARDLVAREDGRSDASSDRHSGEMEHSSGGNGGVGCAQSTRCRQKRPWAWCV